MVVAMMHGKASMVFSFGGKQQVRVLAILDDQAVIIHGHSVKGMEQVVRCYENASETSSDLDVEETKRDLVSSRISYVLYTSFSFWICCTIATKKGIFLQGM